MSLPQPAILQNHVFEGGVSCEGVADHLLELLPDDGVSIRHVDQGLNLAETLQNSVVLLVDFGDILVSLGVHVYGKISLSLEVGLVAVLPYLLDV